MPDDDSAGGSSSDTDEEDAAFEAQVLEALNGERRISAQTSSRSDTGKRNRDDDDKGNIRYTKLARGTMDRQSGILQSQFALLPEDCVNMVLRHLSPNELVSLSLTCRYFAKQCNQDFLWRQCYVQRFGYSSVAQRNGMKDQYIKADALEIDKEMRMAPEGFEKICTEAAISKRSQVCQNLAPLCGQIAIDRAVSEWKTHRKFSGDVGAHVCSRREGCTYHEVAQQVFVCESTGKVHVCDDSCKERYVDTDLGTEVCEISGVSFDTVLQEEEDDAEQGEQDQHYFEKGYFGRAFEVGYGCDNEIELQTALWGGPTRGY